MGRVWVRMDDLVAEKLYDPLEVLDPDRLGDHAKALRKAGDAMASYHTDRRINGDPYDSEGGWIAAIRAFLEAAAEEAGDGN